MIKNYELGEKDLEMYRNAGFKFLALYGDNTSFVGEFGFYSKKELDDFLANPNHFRAKLRIKEL